MRNDRSMRTLSRPDPVAALVSVVRLAPLALAFAAGCDKPAADSAPVSVTPPASVPAAPLVHVPSVEPSAAGPTASVSASASAVGLLGNAGAVAARPKDAGGKVAALTPTSKHVDGKNFALDLASPGCRAASECVMTITLHAVGDYHVNKEYPYKFIANATPGIVYLAKEGSTFTRAAGDFAERGEKTATMTVRFEAAAPGDAHVAGTYKLSVCSADQCQIEQEKVDLTIPVL